MKVDWISFFQEEKEILILKIQEESLSDPALNKDFESLLLHAITPGGKVLVDLSKVTFMNSYAIRALLVGLEECKTRQAQLALCEVRSEIKMTMRVLHIADLLPIYSTRQDALASM